MATVTLYIPEDESIPIPVYETEGVVKVIRNEPECYAVIESNVDCACNTKDGIAVQRHIFYCKESIVGFPAYYIRTTDVDEFITAVAYLRLINTKSLVFRSQTSEKKFTRFLCPIQHSKLFKSCTLLCGCQKYIMQRDPVYFLEHIVVFKDKKGPTIESVLLEE